MEKNRKEFYMRLVNAGVITRTKYPDWSSYYFTNENKTLELWNSFKNNGIVTQDEKAFFKNYACDLQPNSQYCTTQQTSTPNPTPTTNVFGCVEAVHRSKTGKAYTSDRSQLHITRAGGMVHIFKNDYNFTYRMSTIRKTGTWACDGTDNYKITLTNGQTWFSKDPKWSAVPPTPTPTPTGGGITPTTLTADDLVKGGIVKLGMKGDIVGKIQELLISKGHKDISKDGKVDKIFGRRTKKMVKDFQSANGLNDDGVVGPLTWAKLSDPSLTTTQSDAQKSQVPVNHGKREIDDNGNPFVFDGYNQNWIPDSEYLKLYNTDGTKKLQENIIKNIVIKNLHSLL